MSVAVKTVEEAFTLTADVFQRLLDENPELEKELWTLLNAGQKPFIWRELKGLNDSFFHIVVSKEKVE